jgi:vancomycin resistance protein YoaR
MAKVQPKPVTDLSGPAAPHAGKLSRPKAIAQTTAVPISIAPVPTKPKSAKTPATKPKPPKASKPAAPTKPLETKTPEAEVAATPRHLPITVRVVAGLCVLVILTAVGFEALYAGKVLPGVSADGVDIGGLNQAAAAARIAAGAGQFSTQVLTVTYGNSELRIPVAGLSPKYDAAQAAAQAATYGRTGDLASRFHEQLRALFARPTAFAVYSFDDTRLAPYLVQLDEAIATPVQNASLSFDGDHAVVSSSATGARLDIGGLADSIADRLGATSTAEIPAPIYQLAPDLTSAAVQAVAADADTYLSGPLTLSYSGGTHTVDQQTLVTWLQVSPGQSASFLADLGLAGINPPPPVATLSLNHAAIASYVANLAGSLDQPAKNATLAMQNNQLTVTAPSQNGVSLDQSAAIAAITDSLTKPATDRTITLSLSSTPAAVNENNLASLGITQLISEGETYFPGSPADRLINVRQGAARFNDVLLSPGEVFSFGKLLGEVDASTGYVPELVIDGNHEDYQYGGGLCQVSSTAFRAALLAGLPINERENHSFAISYYQWPASAPGLDATIYYPEVDLKFTNDTGHYILIQTIMNGDDLKFDYYGTKTKQGVIRGPYFIYGNNNATQPSKTVFYRDVEDLTGKVIKTDTFYSTYQSSTNFPIVNTFN